MFDDFINQFQALLLETRNNTTESLSFKVWKMNRKFLNNGMDQASLNIDLYRAVSDNNHSEITYLVKAGAEVKSFHTNYIRASFTEYKNALYTAITDDDVSLDTFKLLISLGAEIKDPEILTSVLQNNRVDILKYLIEEKIFDVNMHIDSYQGKTPIHFVVTFNPPNLPLIKNLIDLGADLTICDYTGKSPLLWAAYQGYVETVEHLLSNYIDFENAGLPDILNKVTYDRASFSLHAKGNYKELVKVLFSHGALLTDKPYINDYGEKKEDQQKVFYSRFKDELYDLIESSIPAIKKIIKQVNLEKFKEDIEPCLRSYLSRDKMGSLINEDTKEQFKQLILEKYESSLEENASHTEQITYDFIDSDSLGEGSSLYDED
jgi:ankyrin repeat protein